MVSDEQQGDYSNTSEQDDAVVDQTSDENPNGQGNGSGEKSNGQDQIQILKAREASEPAILELETNGNGTEGFKLIRNTSIPRFEPREELTLEKLREYIEPWLTALVQSDHLSLLIGAGLTIAAHSQAVVVPDIQSNSEKSDEPETDEEKTQDSKSQMMQDIKIEDLGIGRFERKIEMEMIASAKRAGREKGNFEDLLRIINEAIRGLEIILKMDPEKPSKKVGAHEGLEKLQEARNQALEKLSNGVLNGEFNLANAPSRGKAFGYLISFLMSFASRAGTRERLHIFTTNYDRVIEATADVAGLRLMDRFVGALSPIFRASRLDVDMHYNPPGIRGEPRYLEGVARFTKLHGSLDWVNTDDTIRKIGLPFGAKSLAPYWEALGLQGANLKPLMIYPNEAKDRETALYPYVELFRDFAAALCRPNSTLICYGYSFGDEHINRVIEDMLTIPSTHLVIISYDDPLGRIMCMYEKFVNSGKSAQITLLIGNRLGDLKTLVKHFLPKPAIDRATSRMTELLEKRLGNTIKSQRPQQSTNPQLGQTSQNP